MEDSPTGKPSRFPHTLVLIFGLVVLAHLLTFVVPSGEFVGEPAIGTD